MTRPKNVWDAVWGQIELSDAEWELINLPAYQRLRRIHQLALTSLVFPGATHSRFEHGIGSAHVAGRIASRLVDLRTRGERTAPFDDRDRTIVRLAALLHDLGHGPFSHVSDPFLGDKGHEWVAAMAALHDPAINAIVERAAEGGARAIADILLGQGRRSIARDIVSGPTDADKIDYLRRDSHYTGVSQGPFDYEYFLDQVVGIELGGESWLGFRANAIWAVEGLILARYQMRRTVYGHRNRVVTDLMLQRGLAEALGSVLPRDLLARPDESGFLAWFEQYVAYDDWRVFESCVDSTGEAGRVFRRLRDHDLLKICVFLDSDEFRDRLGVVHARRLLAAKGVKLEGDFSATLATRIGLEARDVIAHVIDEKHVLQSPDPLEDQDINFETAEGRIEPFTSRSEIFSANATPRFPQLAVYAARGRRGDPELAKTAETAVIELLKSQLEEEGDG